MGNLKVEISDGKGATDYIHIKGGQISAEVKVAQYQDKDTSQFVIYIPSLEITGYGETYDKAYKMARFSIDEYFTYLNSLSPKKVEIELRNLGWKHNPLKHKEYSKAYIDVTGQLKEFALDDTLKVSVLTAA